MDVGVDTFRSRLDLITWDGFRRWNGGTMSGGQLVGGQAAFAGRHFLGGADFLWGHGEATDCMSNPSPSNLSQLATLTPLIAPIQAPFSDRQPMTGVIGSLYGAIDARALCDRLAAAVEAGEFTLPAGGRVLVWLSIDPGVEFSADYWAGWANQVNTFAYFVGEFAVQQPFQAAVLCRFDTTQDGTLRPDARVVAALQAARTAWPASDTMSHACWADAPTTATPNWAVFAGGPTPLVWRTAQEFNQTGFPVNSDFNVDRANPGGGVANALDFMLRVQQWQPTTPTINNLGIIHEDKATATATRITDVKAAPMPQMKDKSGHFTIPQAHVAYIGRYLKPTVHPADLPTRAEARRISDATLDTFTIWEDGMALFANQNIGYFDPAKAMGTSDGKAAFEYCGNKLGQPPHTPVFFTIDNFDPAAVSGSALTTAKTWILNYISLIKAERDTYVAAHPDFPYMIGLYANGEVLRWCYVQGDLDMFWQTVSTQTSGSAYPNRPWYHANRWQYSWAPDFKAAGWTTWIGADPDADWGDGGRWNLRNPLVNQLDRVRLSALMSIPYMARLYNFLPNPQ
jgi:hypothetical protein